jgi:Na+/H+-translocating membrane pyrophosphatase
LESFFGLLLAAFGVYLLFGLRKGPFTPRDRAAFRKVDEMRKAIKEAEGLMGISKPPDADHAVNLTIKSKKPETKAPDS